MTAAVQGAQLATQMAQVIKDIAELRAETRAWQDGHEKAHVSDEAARIVGRRWLVTTAIAASLAIAGLYPLVIALAHIH